MGQARLKSKPAQSPAILTGLKPNQLITKPAWVDWEQIPLEIGPLKTAPVDKLETMNNDSR